MARPRQVSDENILAAARQCFLRDGPSVSTTVIAKAVGVSQAALFKRFGTKDDLMYAALLPPEVPEWIRHVDLGLDDRPIPEQLLDIAQRMNTFFVELTPCLMTLKASGVDMRVVMQRFDVPPPVRGRAAMVRWFQQAIETRRIHASDADALAYMLIGSLHGRAFLAHISGLDGPVDHTLEEMVATLWRGLRPEGAA